MPNNEPSTTRPPLREAQAELTRERIFEAVADLAAAGPIDAVTLREIADAAGISERTLYRHFADRQALLDGLVEWLTERMESIPLEATVTRASDLPDLARAIFPRFDEVAGMARASILLGQGTGSAGADHAARTERIRSVIASSYPSLPGPDVDALLAVVRTLMSSHTWLRMHDEFGLDGAAAGDAVARAVEVLLADADRKSRRRVRD